MTTTMPPHAPGWSRKIPDLPTPEQVALLRELLDQSQKWVLRSAWSTYLRTHDRTLTVSTDRLTRDQLVAIHAWLRQQRHHLHRALEGDAVAPDGWIEQAVLYRYVRDRANLEY